MPDQFRAKTVLVAGGTGGLGYAVSVAFLKEGAAVYVTYRSEEEFSALRRLSGEGAERLRGLRADVTSEKETGELFREIGRLDILVNAVGAYAGGTPLWETGLDTFERMLSLNLRSGFLLARSAVPAMLRQRSGVIVNISSRSAVDHAAGASAYAASKAAALAMIDSLAADLKGTGVRVNTVLPSIIDTESNRRAMPGADHSKWPKPEEIARVILFLSSEAAGLLHGAAVPVYGAD
jgi:NAD(P)-dependent dehydrogenase (short-subunit alcohol dehydrogenase family)